MNNRDRFNREYRSYEITVEKSLAKAQSHARSIEYLRGCMWDQAHAYKQMQQLDHNELVDRIKQRYGDGPKVIDEWLERTFAHYSIVNEDHIALLRRMDEGLTRKQFVKSGITARRETWPTVTPFGKKKASTTTVPPVSPPQEAEPVEDQLKVYKLRCTALERRNRELEKRIGGLESDLAERDATIRRLKKKVNRVAQMAAV